MKRCPIQDHRYGNLIAMKPGGQFFTDGGELRFSNSNVFRKFCQQIFGPYQEVDGKGEQKPRKMPTSRSVGGARLVMADRS